MLSVPDALLAPHVHYSPVTLKQPEKERSIIIPILQSRQLEPRELGQLVYGHTAGSGSGKNGFELR